MPDEILGVDSHNRVKVFVDFWNFTLSMGDVERGFETDWKTLGPVLARAASEIANPDASEEYQGLNFYGSYDPSSERGAKRHKWAKNTLSLFPGVTVSIVPRQKTKSHPKCPVCQNKVVKCIAPECQADMRGTEERGVDVRMAADMISLAWAGNYNVGVLVSSDKDFEPVAELLNVKGIKIIHGSFPLQGSALARKCWGSINLAEIRDSFRRNNQTK